MVALVERKEYSRLDDLLSSSRIIGLFNIQNPENAGSTLRTAAALGYTSVFLTSDCADIWSPRALRAGAGVQLSCNIYRSTEYLADIDSIKKSGFRFLTSALHNESVSVEKINRNEHLFVAVGNEGNGLRDEVIRLADQIVHIPMNNAAESLNASAAAAILMWELRDPSI